MVKGGHIQTKEKFTYGRFETLMRPAFGSGVVGGFFLFDDTPGFQNNWQELDFEFIGKNTNQIDTNIIRTVGSVTDKNINIKKHILNRRSSDVFWKLTLDWVPDRVIWKVNDVIIRTTVISLNKPMKLEANLWMVSNDWAGKFDAGLLPQLSEYEYISYSKFGNGTVTQVWRDSFHTFDLNRWQVGNWSIGDTQLTNDNVLVADNQLLLTVRA